MKDPHGDVFCKCYWICHDCNLYFLDYTCCPLPGSRWPRSWRQGWQRWERWEIEAWRLLSAANRRFLWNFGFVGRLFDWNQNLRTIQIEQQMFLLFAPWQPCILCVCVWGYPSVTVILLIAGWEERELFSWEKGLTFQHPMRVPDWIKGGRLGCRFSPCGFPSQLLLSCRDGPTYLVGQKTNRIQRTNTFAISNLLLHAESTRPMAFKK